VKENISFAGFPAFDSIICSVDIHELLKQRTTKTFMKIFGTKVILLEVMPANTAMFLNGEGEIVAVFKDGMVAFPGDGK